MVATLYIALQFNLLELEVIFHLNIIQINPFSPKFKKYILPAF